jgi:hypothetical protein
MVFGEAPTKLRNTAKPDGMNRRGAALSSSRLAISLSVVKGVSRCARRIELGPLIGAGDIPVAWLTFKTCLTVVRAVEQLVNGGASPEESAVPR